ncbi:hypothetical protein BN14_07753 [Rhizoctonia solani AG-1 IB]|uniref:Uncharacterized protein n=1 Tax=Thanatephorus cucumeris (strain AG1-IB / isolate 7/3/14) TaxID=1108050 RepID=M5C114_THACB|nr:hypothetical protein BN14_07753 [Rhizoctonia solani AG-1 IB]
MRFMSTCLKYVNGVRPHDIRVHCVFEPIDKPFGWFFDPDDIAEGGLLILCITGHGGSTDYGVEVTDSFGRALVDTIKLHTAINKLQVPCTLEIVIGTCNSEGLAAGLQRLLVMDPEAPNKVSSSEPSVLLGSLCSRPRPHPRLNWLVPKLRTGATVIAWSASVYGGNAYGRRTNIGSRDIMIEGICNVLESGQPISRDALFRKICEPISEFNDHRAGKFRRMTDEEQIKQLVLDSPVFVAIKQVEKAVDERAPSG